jgi:hypothetical protein
LYLVLNDLPVCPMYFSGQPLILSFMHNSLEFAGMYDIYKSFHPPYATWQMTPKMAYDNHEAASGITNEIAE